MVDVMVSLDDFVCIMFGTTKNVYFCQCRSLYMSNVIQIDSNVEENCNIFEIAWYKLKHLFYLI